MRRGVLLRYSAWLVSTFTVLAANHTGLELSWANSTRHHNGSELYPPLFDRPSNSTPRFHNQSQAGVNPLNAAAGYLSLSKRQSNGLPEGTCAPGVPCANGACCNSNGACGYSPDYCGADVCISKCDSKAECGQYAPEGKQKCPLNVCCSEFGFCGTTDEFCGSGCQASAGGCGPTPTPRRGGNRGGRKQIAYYESWANTRPCDAVEPQDLDLTGITHLNFAFAFFDPTTFEMTAMDANADSLLAKFTNLKSTWSSLETWIAVGGWSFNDETNTPNTRTAFSDMASTATGRRKFINSAMHFMRTYGFDGLDIDWEYPGAEDRGGRESDTANFVLLCKELKAAFGNRYGLTVTLPASYWYLRHFDVKGMEPYVDWYNVMSYDIHGIWDSSSRFTGPYARPHTNLTEIDGALSLLWRAGVSAGNVVLGLGWYGRSFKLADPSCSRPGCPFSEGAAAGPCSATSGVLLLSEIERTIEEHSLTPQFDQEAAVNWITWNQDQWVSYDNTKTFQMKIDYANRLGLGGTMIWAVDQGSNKTNSKAGMFFEGTSLSKENFEIEQKASQAASSCYTTFCGGSCAAGYNAITQSRGRIGELGVATACKNGQVQTLCCLSGMYLGRCDWYGWRGEGLSCSGGCPADHTPLAVNTNQYFYFPEQNYKEDKWCNGGSQTYCCNDVRTHSMVHHEDHIFVEPEHIVSDPNSLQKRSSPTCAMWGVIFGGAFVFATIISGGTITLAGGAIIALESAVVTSICAKTELDKSAMTTLAATGIALRSGTVVNANGKRPHSSSVPVVTINKRPKTNKKPGFYGVYAVKVYASTDTTCSLTYTCEYNRGFDQICDNQRWGMDSILPGTTTFYYDGGGRGAGRKAEKWRTHHNAVYRGTDQVTNSNTATSSGGRGRCEVDEWPLGTLQEAANGAPQALRYVDGEENGRQGRDWLDWLRASYSPCATLLRTKNPPITWRIGDIPVGDTRNNANGVIKKYGFDSFSGKDPCFATLRPPYGGAGPVPIPDHGFRVDNTIDPLITYHGNPAQDYRMDPTANNWVQPTSVNSAAFMKRELGPLDYMFDGNTTTTPTISKSASPEPELIMDAATTVAAQTTPGSDSPKATAVGTATLLQSAKETGEQQGPADGKFTEPIPTFRPEVDRETRLRFHKYYSVKKMEYKREEHHIHNHAHGQKRKIGD